MKKQNIVLLSILAPMAILTACSQSDIDKQVQPQMKDDEQNNNTPGATDKPNETNPTEPTEKSKEELMQDKIDEQGKDIKDLSDEVAYYRDFVKELTATFTTEEMDSFIDNEWNYKLMINNINFPKNGILELSEDSFDLVLEEARVPYSLIPEDLSLKGKAQNKIIFEQDVKSELNEKTEKNVTTFTYSFKDVPSKTTIKMEITDELMQELKLDTKILQITVQ